MVVGARNFCCWGALARDSVLNLDFFMFCVVESCGSLCRFCLARGSVWALWCALCGFGRA